MEIFLATDRLRLRRFTEDDLDHLYQLDRDPEVMRLLTNGVPTPYQTVRDEVLPRALAEYDRSPAHGHWAAIERSTDDFLGWFGLALPDQHADPDHADPAQADLGQADLGYRLRRSAWGKGYATEGSRALIRKAFTELGLRRVYAQTMAVNLASRRVMEKVGMRHVRTFHLTFDDPIPGTELGEVEYAITRAEWESRRTTLAP